MIRRPPRSTRVRSSAASDVYKRQPLTTLRVAELSAEANLPEGVLNVVTGGPETGQALVAHPGVRRIAFTGQTSTGQKIMETAGPALKHVSLELGGSDPT